MENKYFATSNYDRFTSNTLNAKITQKKLINESDLNDKITIRNKRRNQNIRNKRRTKGRAR